jgi:hypothetical protein
MKLYEIYGVRYYHGSKTKFSVGDILTPQSEGYVMGSGLDHSELEAHMRLEQAMEDYRPASAVPRQKAVFMVTDPEDIDYAGGYTDFIYEVVPLGPVTKANLHWYSALNNYVFDEDVDPEVVKKLASQYWNATPSKHSLFEYLTPAARIIAITESDDDQ